MALEFRWRIVVVICLAMGWAAWPCFGRDYTADFSSTPPGEFSAGEIIVSNKGDHKFLGKFLQQGVVFTLPDLGPHEAIHLTFDMVLLQSWNGCSATWGPDVWTCAVDGGPTLLRTTFSNCGFFTDNNEQNYPDAYPSFDGMPSHPAWTGSTEHGTFGNMQDWGGPARTFDCSSVYHFDWTFPHSEPKLKLNFSSVLQRNNNRPFGFTSFKVETLDKTAQLTNAELLENLTALPADDPAAANTAVWKLISSGDQFARFLKSHPAAVPATTNATAELYRLSRLRHVLEVINTPTADKLLKTMLAPGEAVTMLAGHVVDDAGQPVGGAHVTLHISSAPSAGQTSNTVDKMVFTASDGAWSYAASGNKIKQARVGAWHERYVEPAGAPSQESTPLSKLFDGSAILTLERGIPVEGVVFGPDGKPLKGALVNVEVGKSPGGVIPPEKTGADGRFARAARPADPVRVTVTSRGYAPEVQQFTMSDVKKELTIQLLPPAQIKVRVVDGTGAPVPDASVVATEWRGSHNIVAQFRRDPDGLFSWDQAPHDTVFCDIAARGYMRLQHQPLQPGDQETVVTLQPTFRLRGSVVDAQTDLPIDVFRLVPGFVSRDGSPVVWDRTRSEEKKWAGRFDLMEELPRAGYAVRIEARGYYPAESPVFASDRGGSVLEMRLTPGDDLVLTVFDPSGQFANRAMGLQAIPGEVAHEVNGAALDDGGCAKSNAGPDGQLAFSPQSGPFKVLVVHPSGYVEVDESALAKSHDVHLQPWARIEGMLKVDGKPAADQDLWGTVADPNEPAVHLEVRGKTDAQGRFYFECVPAGKVSIGIDARTLQQVDVVAGQTRQVVIGS